MKSETLYQGASSPRKPYLWFLHQVDCTSSCAYLNDKFRSEFHVLVCCFSSIKSEFPLVYCTFNILWISSCHIKLLCLRHSLFILFYYINVLLTRLHTFWVICPNSIFFSRSLITFSVLFAKWEIFQGNDRIHVVDMLLLSTSFLASFSLVTVCSSSGKVINLSITFPSKADGQEWADDSR